MNYFSRNMSVGTQILILPLIALAGFCAILVFQYLSMSYQDRIGVENQTRLALEANIRDFQAQMAQMRFSEKDFVSSHSLNDTRKHLDSIKKIYRTLAHIETSANAPLIDGNLLLEWRAMLEKYQTDYLDSATEIETIGFSQNVGLRGSMRNAIHIVERKLKDKSPVLMRDMLQMRRHEKDFIIRKEEKFYKAWEQSVPVFLKNVAQSNLSIVDRTVIEFSTSIYVASFRNLADHTRDLITDATNVENISAEILSSVEWVSTTQTARANSTIRTNSKNLHSSFQVQLGLTLFASVLVMAAAGAIGHKLQSMLRLLTNATARLAKGDIHVRIPATSYRNEIGTMANALRVFRSAEKSKLFAEISLKKATQETEDIISSLNEALFQIDKFGVIKKTNPACERLWGANSQELLGRKLTDLFLPQTSENRISVAQLAQLSAIQGRLEKMDFASTADAAPLMDAAGMAVILIGEGGTIAQINTIAAENFGYKQADLIGRKLDLLIPLAARANYQRYVDSALNERRGQLVAECQELTLQHKDGHEIATVISLASFELAGKMHMLLVCDRKGAVQTLGAAPEPMHPGLFNGITIDQAVARFTTAYGHGVVHEDEIATASGAIVPVTYSGALLGDDPTAPTGAIVTVQDITERKQYDQKVLQFKRTLDQSGDQVYWFQPETYEIFYKNRAADDLVGHETDQYATPTILDVTQDLDPDEFGALVAPLICGEDRQVLYEWVEDIHGTPQEVSIEYVAQSEDAEAYFVAVVRDITERKAADVAKSEFISTVSHELRTPLTSIKGALGIIKSGAVGELNDKLGHLVTMALSNSDRLLTLINDILDIEKIAAGKMEFKLEPIDICAVLDEAIVANEGYAKTYGVTFRSKIMNGPILVNGDKLRLAQVMSNLMSNAAKFSDTGQEIDISATCSNGKVTIQVRDHGCGIPKAAQATIFDKFTQADQSDSRQKGGTGLGLNIVKMMVGAHGSDISFDSVEGKGTAFHFDLDVLAS